MYWKRFKGKSNRSHWGSVVDAKLRPFVLIGSGLYEYSWPPRLLAIIATIIIFALAGPTWEKLSQPVYQTQAATIILLDLSQSM
eukprot:UN12610